MEPPHYIDGMDHRNHLGYLARHVPDTAYGMRPALPTAHKINVKVDAGSRWKDPRPHHPLPYLHAIDLSQLIEASHSDSDVASTNTYAASSSRGPSLHNTLPPEAEILCHPRYYIPLSIRSRELEPTCITSSELGWEANWYPAVGMRNKGSSGRHCE